MNGCVADNQVISLLIESGITTAVVFGPIIIMGICTICRIRFRRE